MPIKDSLILKSDNPLWKEILKTRIKLNEMDLTFWLKNNIFSLVWWLMLVLFISFWFIWWKHVNKTRLLEIVTFGVMVAFIATVVDIFGCEYVRWGYPVDLDPLITPETITDFCILPVTYMLLYQYFTDWKSFTIAAVVISAILAFVAEPIAILLDIYQMNNWNHLYSFLMYILLALTLKWLMNKIVIIQKKVSIEGNRQ